MASTTIKTRIQLKSDTEANWEKATNFYPLKGEVIIYLPDDSHLFSRLKVGDGETLVSDLPFIDAQTINGIDINSITVSKLSHSLTFGSSGNYVFDGSADVTVPQYTGSYS